MKILLIAMLFTGCASTTFYRDGKVIARFQGNMKGMRFEAMADGSVRWAGDINHSTPTRAGGSVIGTGLAGLTSLFATRTVLP